METCYIRNEVTMKSLELTVPDDLYGSMGEAEMRALAQEALLVRLYELGKIGSGRAAQLLGVSRRAFLVDVLPRYGLSHFDEDIDLPAEAARG
jgi:predicted HTH domain antitoxin